MSEEPAPFWVIHPAPYWHPGLKAWVAALARVDVFCGEPERLEEGDAFETEAEALLASQTMEDERTRLRPRRDDGPFDARGGLWS
jgi:hypothetical protein